MQKYVFLAKISNEFASAMLNKPQDRLEIVQPILTALNIEVCEFLFTSDSDFNFVGVLKANLDDDVEALKNIIFASGNFSECTWIRAYESSEYKDVFERGSKVMDNYVSSMVIAENSK
tara:strand:- start:149 stop:502 length:354 start_codon:yes stop_codon:yes gene_type:complete